MIENLIFSNILLFEARETLINSSFTCKESGACFKTTSTRNSNRDFDELGEWMDPNLDNNSNLKPRTGGIPFVEFIKFPIANKASKIL